MQIELMGKNVFCLLIWILFIGNSLLEAQIALDAGTNLVNQEKLKYHSYKKEDLGYIKPQEDAELTFVVATNKYIERQYELSSRIPLIKQSIKAGEKLLIAFQAKTVEASLETGEAKVLWQLNISEDRKEKIRNVMSIGSEWKSYYVPIEIGEPINHQHLNLNLQFGFPPQKLLLREIGLYVFDKDIPFDELPKTQITYPGMEAEAPWRKAAAERIEAIRKGDFKITITQKGKPLEGVGLEINQIKHHFDWGVAIKTTDIIDNEAEQKRLADNFTVVVYENDLKIKFYDRRKPKDQILKGIDQLRRRGLKIKGHVLIWPGFRHLTPEIKKTADNPAQVKKIIANHLDKILQETKGKIDSWDVVNEAYTNKDLQKITGSEAILYSGFEKLKREYPNIQRFTNEFGIINRGGLNVTKQQWYYDFIKRIDEHTEGAVDGIGIQSHIGTDLTAPEKVLDILDFYGKLGKNISISEFTMDIQDPVIRQLYTEDFLTAAFSHPQVSEFLFWGYKGGLKSKSDIFQDNGSLGTMGKAFFGMVHQLWKTKITSVTNKDGELKTRGFYGTYEYVYTINGQIRKGKFKLLPGQETIINLEIP